MVSAPAFAQQAGSPPPAPGAGGALGEIVVTSERHAQNILTVPAAIQAESSEQLNDAGIHDFTDLQFITPGYLPSDGSGYTQLFIRGIGNSVFVGPDPSVATYIDDVPRIWGSMPNQFIDVQRVEVLKGAQGGLYGRNATGGVVNIISRQPNTHEMEATGSISYGEFNTVSAAGYLNIPLADSLALSLAVEDDSHDPYIKNLAISNPYSAADFTGTGSFGTQAQTAALLNSYVKPQSGFAGANTYGGDSKLLWRPTSTFKITFGGDYYFKNDTGGSQLVNVTPAYTGAVVQGLLSAFGTNPVSALPAGFVQPSGKFQSAIGDTQNVQLRDWGWSATAVWNAPGVDVTSITALRGQHTEYLVDLGASSIPTVSASVDNKKQFIYQEFRAVSTSQGPFHWLGGATFLNDYYTGATSVGYFGLPGAPSVHVHDLIKNYTVYGQLGYDITSKLNLTASLRWLQEDNTANFVYPSVSTAASSEHALIPSATLSYALDHGSVYFRWARGFKAGGINPVAAPSTFINAGVPLSDGAVFGPEKVDTYEAGYKQALLDHKLQITGDLYFNQYTGLQETGHAEAAYAGSIILAIVNAGSAQTYGAESSVTYQLFRPVTVGFNVGYLSAKYINFVIPVTSPQVLAPTDLSGTRMLNSPKWQLSFTVNLDQPINDKYRLVGNLVESYISSQIFDQSLIPGVLPNAVGPAYAITNLRLGVRTTDGKYEAAVYANNLFDRAYYTYGSSDSFGNSMSWGNPRVVGVQLTAKY